MPLNIVELELVQGLSRYRNAKPLRHYSMNPVSYAMRMGASPIFDSNHSRVLVHQIVGGLMTDLKHLSTSSWSDELLSRLNKTGDIGIDSHAFLHGLSEVGAYPFPVIQTYPSFHLISSIMIPGKLFPF